MLQKMIQLIQECWSQNAAARLTSLRVNKKLGRLLSDCRNIQVTPAREVQETDVNINIKETEELINSNELRVQNSRHIA